MEKITFYIDGIEIAAENGQTVLEAALKNKIYIPHLCHHPELNPAGICRLCYVEIEGKGPALSCRSPAKEGMVVKTRTDAVDEIRRGLVELLVANHHDDCRNCAKKGRCELQKIMGYLRLDKKRAKRLRFAEGELERDTSNPFFDLDPNKCVLCGICVRTCSELLKIDAIAIIGRGHQSRVAPLGQRPIAQSDCQSCGECVERCPVGGLVYKKYQRPKAHVPTVCPYCSTGCRITLGLQNSTIVSAEGSPLCGRGRFGWRYVCAPDRLHSPMIKKEGKFVESSWDEAVKTVAREFLRYKGDQIAVMVSAKCTNEEAYFIQKFARSVLGTNNIDNTVRLTHTGSLEALWETTGVAAATNSFEDLEDAASVLIAGANVIRTHPAVSQKLKKAAERGSKLIIIDPVENELNRFAHLWLKPYAGTDLALFMGMAKVIVEEGLSDRDFIEARCENFQEFLESIEDFPLGRVERITGVPRETVVEAAIEMARAKPTSILWSTGITQYSQGKNTVHALINLALLTGNVGKKSSGLYPLLEQSNAQGVCDMGCLPDYYPGYQPAEDSEVRKRFEAAWKTTLSPERGLKLTELWDAILEGRIKALYIVGANPVADLAAPQKVLKSLEKLELLVFQDLFLNETAAYADIVLPAASFAEKEGTFTSAERRLQKVRQAIEPIEGALPDGLIISRIAREMGRAGWEFDPAAIMKEVTSLVPVYAGVSYGDLDEGTFVRSSNSPTLHASGFSTQNGKGRFIPLEYTGPMEHPDIEFPLTLLIRRNTLYYDTCAHKVEGFRQLVPKEYLRVNPKDAVDLGINDGDTVRVISRRGEIEVPARVWENAPPGVVVMDRNSPQNPVNFLTGKEAKVCAVRLEK